MLKDKLVAGVFIFDLLIIFFWSMLFFWHVMLGLVILGAIGFVFFLFYRIWKAVHYVDDHLIHHN